MSMLTFPGIQPVDYLLIGHITQDITPEGNRLGGAVSFSGLTAHALGMRVGIVTSWAEECDPGALSDLSIANQLCDHSTTFENVYLDTGRQHQPRG